MKKISKKFLNILAVAYLVACLVIPYILITPKPVHATGMKQVIVHSYSQLTAGTSYNSFSGAGSNWNANENQVNQVVSFAGYVEKVYIRLSVAPGGVASWTFTLRKNGADTGIVIVLSGTETYDLNITNTVSYSAGDTISWKVVDAGGPAASYAYISCYYVTAVDNTSIILGIGECSNVATRYGGLAQGYYGTVLVASVEQIRQIIPTAGTIKNFYVKLSVASGAGASWTLTVRKNGVNTALSVNLPNTTTGSDLVNTVSVAAGDIIDMEFLEVGACGANSYAGYGFTFVSSGVNGESILLSPGGGGLNNAADRYGSLTGGTTSWTATETSTYDLVQSCIFRNLYVRLSSAPDTGAGTQSFTIALRLNAATQALTVTISEASQTGSDTSNSVTVVGGSFGNMIATPSGTPTVGNCQFGIVCFVDLTVYTVPLGVATVYENLTTGGDAGGTACYGSRWVGQTFTITSAHSITSAKILLQRTGTPGILTLSLKETDASGLPTGADLCSSTYNGDILGTTSYTWTEFTFTEYHLEKGVVYALILRALSGTSANYVQWYWDTGNGYSGGNAVESNDGGAYWYTLGVANNDYLFQIWGLPSLYIVDAKVFESYKTTKDWLIVCHYVNKVAPYYPTGDVATYFSIQLRSTSVVVEAENPCWQWGDKPGSIYLSAAQVKPLNWLSTSYIIEIIAKYDSSIYATYTLTASDWMGQDLDRLDAYCFDIAHSIEDNAVMGSADANLTFDMASKGEVLNDTGTVYFVKGVPGLMKVRPKIFQTVVSSSGLNDTRGIKMRPSYQTVFGPYVTERFEALGQVAGVNGRTAGVSLLVLFYLGLLSAFGTGHNMIGLSLSFPFLIVGIYTGLLVIAVVAALFAVIAVMTMRQLWASR